MTFAEDLADPDSQVVREALTRTCRFCRAKPGIHCREVVIGQLARRSVHWDRATNTEEKP